MNKMPELRVAVGSCNPVKVEAVRRAFTAAFGSDRAIVVNAFDVASGVADQPFGSEETRRGASNRAKTAAAIEGHHFGVGLEGGVSEADTSGRLECFALMAILRVADGREGSARTATFLLPPRVTRLLRGQEPGHPKMELGSANDLAPQTRRSTFFISG